jgi:hypothetical protein
MNEVRMHFMTGPDFTPIPLLKTTVLVQMTEGTVANPFPPPPTLPSGTGTNPITFTILNGDLTTLLYDMPTPLVFPFVPPAPGIAVFFNGFAPLTALNSTQGVYITRIISTITFEVAGFDASGINANPVNPITGLVDYSLIRANMIIAKNRIAMSMRFTSVANKTTNYIVVSKS